MKIYCIDENVKDTLLSKGIKLITVNKNSNKDVYIFEYNPKTFSLNFSDPMIRKTCYLSDKLLMTF